MRGKGRGRPSLPVRGIGHVGLCTDDGDTGALEEDCRLADIVIAPFTIGRKCRAARVIGDRRMLKAQGAHALYIEGLSIRTETVAAACGRRPWTPERRRIPAMGR